MVMCDDSVEILAWGEGVFRIQVWKVVSPNIVHAPWMSEEEKLSSKQWLNLGHDDKISKSLYEDRYNIHEYHYATFIIICQYKREPEHCLAWNC